MNHPTERAYWFELMNRRVNIGIDFKTVMYCDEHEQEKFFSYIPVMMRKKVLIAVDQDEYMGKLHNKVTEVCLA